MEEPQVLGIGTLCPALAWNKKTAPSSWAEAFECAIADIDDQPTADVVPRAEVANEIIFDLACKLHTMLPYKIHPIPIDGKIECNTYELGQEHIIFNTLKYLGELEKKYAEDE